MDELSIIADLLPPADPPTAAAVGAGYARLATLMQSSHATARADHRAAAWAGDRADHKPARRTHRRPSGRTAGLTATAAVAAVIAVVASSAGHGAGQGGGTGSQVALTARQVLLTAAVNVVRQHPALTSGRYWRERTIMYLQFPAGTPAHPYNVLGRKLSDSWEPAAPGQPVVSRSQNLISWPATPADAAAWRAAGSPTSWTNQNGEAYGTFSTRKAGPAQIYRLHAGGQIRCYLSDYPYSGGLTAAQCRNLPRTVTGLTALLTRWAQDLARMDRQPRRVQEFVGVMAISLLTDPVASPQVRAAALRIIAAYPQVRLIAKVKDPLGRPGYDLLVTERYVTSNLIISATTGQVLDQFLALTNPRMFQASPADSGNPYTGRWYRGLVSWSLVYVSLGWTNASPPKG